MKQPLAAIELDRHDWGRLRVADGQPLDVPVYLRGLIEAETEDQAEGHYWGLENQVVVQGQLFSSALAVVPVILAALTAGTCPRPARGWLLELLYQIVSGVPHADEIGLGNTTLADECRAAATRGLWTLYRELYEGDARGALAVIDALEPGSATAAAIRASRRV